MADPIWIDVTNAGDGVEVVQTLARRGITGVLVISRDAYRIRIQPMDEPRHTLLLDVADALGRSDVAVDASFGIARKRAPSGGPPSEAA